MKNRIVYLIIGAVAIWITACQSNPNSEAITDDQIQTKDLTGTVCAIENQGDEIGSEGTQFTVKLEKKADDRKQEYVVFQTKTEEAPVSVPSKERMSPGVTVVITYTGELEDCPETARGNAENSEWYFLEEEQILSIYAQ